MAVAPPCTPRCACPAAAEAPPMALARTHAWPWEDPSADWDFGDDGLWAAILEGWEAPPQVSAC
jgi:hypothetical protein